MATISHEMQSTATINIDVLNVIYDVTGMTASNKPGPNNATVFNVTMPATYQYNGNFQFFLTSNPTTVVTNTTVDAVTTPGTLIVTCASNSNLAVATDYTMSFDLK
ncbi:hypothetical protein [Clostridium chrysemydis]|uniref:hypothetical protein n=1 Tax=Clostridium chrysemydis TaxID=2665504 RepID=UPI003F35CB92